ncbi:MAG: EamA family transporter RarD [Pirellula sp.]
MSCLPDWSSDCCYHHKNETEMVNNYRGYIQAFCAYALWGIFPLYWKLVAHVPSVEVICHRIVWSLLVLTVLTTYVRQWQDVLGLLKDRKRLALCGLAAVLISVNWLAFIWAVQNGYVVEASLGYFINPLLTVLLAVVIFRERISSIQWLAIATAFVGVGVMTWATGDFPWIAFSLATSFACYAAVKKRTTMPAISGLGMETAILAPLSLVLLGYFRVYDSEAVSLSPGTFGLLILGGPITTLPLVLFASAAKSVPLVAMGMLQYVGPLIQFLLAYFLFREVVPLGQLVGFVIVWMALAVFVWGTIQLEKQKRLNTPQGR